mmetsp:Transcript_20475/g.49830  ORF Transcript_20475/g.49830 Transcript_20475/m.49830 type:complete len:83 (+) Transcript_20475:1299-1547(+)
MLRKKIPVCGEPSRLAEMPLDELRECLAVVEGLVGLVGKLEEPAQLGGSRASCPHVYDDSWVLHHFQAGRQTCVNEWVAWIV